MIEDKDMGWDRIKRELEKIDGSFTTVGIHASEDARDDEVGNAQVLAFHEFGLGVPQRAVLAPTVDDAQDELAADADRLFEEGILEGRVSVERGLDLLGQKLEDKVKDTLRQKRPEWPLLSDATVAKRPGRSANDQLVDTAEMLNSVRHKVEMGGLG